MRFKYKYTGLWSPIHVSRPIMSYLGLCFSSMTIMFLALWDISILSHQEGHRVFMYDSPSFTSSQMGSSEGKKFQILTLYLYMTAFPYHIAANFSLFLRRLRSVFMVVKSFSFHSQNNLAIPFLCIHYLGHLVFFAFYLL